jgi:hypothetical protein
MFANTNFAAPGLNTATKNYKHFQKSIVEIPRGWNFKEMPLKKLRFT